MVPLLKISLTWFRNFIEESFSFRAPVIGICGKNGIGKTNLLDAVYYLCYTKSYFQNKEKNNIHFGFDGFRIEGLWNNKEETICIYKDGKKTIIQNNSKYEKVADHIGKYHAIMIAPDDLNIINQSSEIRRKFIDGILAQTNHDYLENLLTYQKVLLQKNAYLKQLSNTPPDWQLLDVYDSQLAQSGSVLLKKRKAFSKILPDKIKQAYRELSRVTNEEIDVAYQTCSEADKLLNLFQYNRQYDLQARRTIKGPHTEDWIFTLNNESLKTHASQGQKKSFLISLKLSQLMWLQEHGKMPILLMDDIFEKLDKNRINHLFDMLKQFKLAQIFITHTDKTELENTLPLYHNDYQIIELK